MKHNYYLRLKARLFFKAIQRRKITLRKLWNVFHCSLAYALKWKKSASFPFILSLELWNECNAGCLFCRDAKGTIYNLNPDFPSKGAISKGQMPPAMAMDIISQMKEDVLIAVLYTNGEPLLYKELPAVVHHATANGVMSMIATNGLLFNADNARQVLEAGIDFIKIQLSGYTQDIYSIQIRYGHVEKLKDNIRMLARLNKEGNHRALIMIDYILYKYNAHQLPLVKRFCDELGLMMNVRSGNPRWGLEDKENPMPTATLPMSCDWLWKAMQVNFNGDVLQCCEAVIWSNSKPYETFKTGQTKAQDVWNGPAAIATRQTMATRGRKAIPICAQCQRQGVCFKW